MSGCFDWDRIAFLKWLSLHFFSQSPCLFLFLVSSAFWTQAGLWFLLFQPRCEWAASDQKQSGPPYTQCDQVTQKSLHSLLVQTENYGAQTCRGEKCCCSVAQSCPTLCNPMDRSTPGLPVHHQLPKFAQTHVCWLGDAVQTSHSLSSPSPAFNLSQHQGLFQWVGSEGVLGPRKENNGLKGPCWII